MTGQARRNHPEAAQNPIFREILENLHSRCARLWGSSPSSLISVPEIIRQLKEIYSALEKREPETAGRLLDQHVRYSIYRIKSQLL